ncbi:thiosulfate sulfurtransferase [Cryobacterium sp. MLB-32]|uniref:sulfurtransferase n=1 Tax=Cryobacterium sp. MLB-32 TaxID=1529318 RepID=UPI0004E742C5|nr:sulfurtransferase [Cryobacterium sp. MLB-32]KFF60071.1 thiosulfate sulfurtransferase [Cryobacterium sp. MLB-32]
MTTLISPLELAHELDAGRDLRVLDVRWKLGAPSGLVDYRSGHIPGAVYVDLERQLAGHGLPTDGRHPLPSRDALQAAARSWGINPGDTVVVYDDLGNQSAARAWWLLSHAGIENVLLLDGALAAWRAAGLPLETGDAQPEPGTVLLSYGSLPTLDADSAAELARHGVLLDARAAPRFRGEVEPIDPRAGHIPGAISAPGSDLLDAEGCFLPVERLRAHFLALGARDAVGVYCGSGVTAAHTAAALTIAGFRPALYPGSWSQWSNLPGRPVATGD